MKNSYLLVLASLLSSCIACGQIVSKNEYTGFWNQGSTWVGGIMPGSLSAGTITVNTDATINGTVKSATNFVVSGTSILSVTDLVINSGDTLVLLGDFTESPFSTVTNNGVFVVMGNYYNNGSSFSSMTNAGKMVVTGGYSTNNLLGTGNTFNPTSYVYGSTTGFPFGGPSLPGQGNLMTNDMPLYNWVNTMNAVLPIQLVYFKAALQNNDVALSWRTSSELNNDRFIVERSADGIQFKMIAEVAGAGNSETVVDYEYVDHTPMSGTSYYRLTQVDYDGTPTPFTVVSVKGIPSFIEAYPNPAMDYLFFSHVREEDNVSVDDLRGNNHALRFQIEELAPGKLGIDVRALEPGIYILRIDSEEEAGNPIRFVKQ